MIPMIYSQHVAKLLAYAGLCNRNKCDLLIRYSGTLYLFRGL